jgi:hypothetical protein
VGGPRLDDGANARGPEASDDALKSVPPAPMSQDKRGWRVAPAPDGRGTPEEHKPAPPHWLRGFWIFVLVLLAINWISVLVAQPSSATRVKIPFNRFFLSEVQAGQVKSISSKGDTINGTFTTELRHPAGDAKRDAYGPVLDRGPDVLEQRCADLAAPVKERAGQRAEPESGGIAAVRAADRLRTDAAAGRAVRADRAARTGGRRRARRTG